MTQTIKINEQDVSVKEFDGQRVITFKDIDRVHNRPKDTARKRFNDNKDHLIEGVDYFVRKTDEAMKEYGIMAPNGLNLITESGYLMLVKSFTDDLAWEVQRQLVNTYFKAKTELPKPPPVGEVANLIKPIHKIMSAQGSSPQMIAKTTQMLLSQFGIELPANFVEPTYEQVVLTTTITQTMLVPTQIEGQEQLVSQ